MCGRFTLKLTARLLAVFLGIDEPEAWQPRFNLAPSQSLLAVIPGKRGREWLRPRWGLVPAWACDPKTVKPLINARGETIGEKPSFREAFRRRRCLIPADGFYEWQGTGRGKVPFWFHRRNGDPFALAGVWEPGKNGADPTCAIVTTDANEVVAAIHERMPVMLTQGTFDLWLTGTIAEASSLMKPFSAEDLVTERVSERVNSPRNDDEGCIRPDRNLLD